MLHVDFRERSGASLEMTQIQKPKKGVVFNIVHPDQSAYMLELPSNCTGQNCLDKVGMHTKSIKKGRGYTGTIITSRA